MPDLPSMDDMGTLWLKTRINDKDHVLNVNEMSLMYSVEVYGSDESTIIDACENYYFFQSHHSENYELITKKEFQFTDIKCLRNS